jgi:hypothetical protein
MPRFRRPNMPLASWRARSLTLQTAQKARQAKREMIVVIPLLSVTLYAYLRREELFGVDTPVRVGAAIVMVCWAGRWRATSAASRLRRCSGGWTLPRRGRSGS